MSQYKQQKPEENNLGPYETRRQLRWAYLDYSRSKTAKDLSAMKEHAEKIRLLQRYLGMKELSEFPELGIVNSSKS